MLAAPGHFPAFSYSNQAQHCSEIITPLANREIRNFNYVAQNTHLEIYAALKMDRSAVYQHDILQSKKNIVGCLTQIFSRSQL
jgi:hypothetical protein